MKKFNGYDEAKKSAQSTGGTQLPEGGYVVKVMGVRYEEGQNGNSDYVKLMFDICEGDQEGFFKKQYDEDTSADKWWKGVTNVWVPSDDGSEKDSWTKNTFAKWTDNFEKSNEGYSWDWDESKWKGLNIGLVFRKAGKVSKQGKPYTFTEPAFPIDAETIRTGTIPSAKFKAYKGYDDAVKSENTPSSADFVNINAAIEEDVPF